MNTTQKAVKVLNTISNDLHDLMLNAVFSKHLIDENKYQVIENIKTDVSKANDIIDRINVINDDMVVLLDSIVKECMSSLHEIHKGMREDLIKQNAEEDYAELSARVNYLHEQVERIKNS